jgi:putative ABC transport system permease protein
VTSLVLRGLAARRLRSILTALAVILGVAMVTGTAIMGSTTASAFDHYFKSGVAGSDVVVTARPVVSDADRGTTPPPLPASLVDAVRRVPGVALAQGRVQGSALLIGPSGTVLGADGPPTVGESVVSERLTGVRLTDGRWPRTAGEVTIDRTTAGSAGLRIGDRVGVAAAGPVRHPRIVGLARVGDVGTAGATFAFFDPATGARRLDREGRVDAILVRATRGTAPAALAARIGAAVHAPVAVRVETAERFGARTVDEQGAWLPTFRTALLAFGVIALLVGAFVILNTVAVTVAQRRRELGMLRAVGGSRRQVLTSVLAEALAIGVVGAVLGTVGGIGLAVGITKLFRGLGLTLPTLSPVLTPATLLPGAIAGLAVTLAAAMVPAVRASRMSPVAALSQGSADARRPGRRGLIAGLVLLAVAVAGLGLGLLGDPGSSGARIQLAAVGVLALFVGLATLAPRFVGPLARLIGWPLRRLGGTAGDLAVENVRRNPTRSAATAAALMVGVGVAAFMSIFATSIGTADAKTVERSIRADLVVRPYGNQDVLAPAVAGIARRVDGVAAASPVATEIARAGRGRHLAIGVDPVTLGRTYRLDWRHGGPGTLRTLGPRGALVEVNIAREERVGVGDPITVTAPDGTARRLVVRGTFADPSLAAGVIMTRGTFRAVFGPRHDAIVMVETRAGARAADVQAALRGALAAYPGTRVDSRDTLVGATRHEGDPIVAIVDALLLLSVIISAIGIVNALGLAVLERRRELGTLRAIGTSRRALRRMVRYESIIVALIGTALGLVAGAVLGAMTVGAVDGASLIVPTGQILVILAGSVLLGIVAAAGPARRVGRMRVVAALAE